MKKIRVKAKPAGNMVYNCGKHKAMARILDHTGKEVDVVVVRYEEKDYFVVCYDGLVKECMPL